MGNLLKWKMETDVNRIANGPYFNSLGFSRWGFVRVGDHIHMLICALEILNIIIIIY